jgi:hypothetical protein
MALSLSSFLILFIHYVHALPVAAEAAPINNAIMAVSEQLVKLNGTLNTFQGGLEGTVTALKILSESRELDDKVDDATEVATASTALDGDGSASVANSIVVLSDQVFDVLEIIILKKPEFDKAILGVGSGSFLVKHSLTELKTSTTDFGTSVTAKLVKELAELAPLVLSTITFRFDEAFEGLPVKDERQ